MLRFDRWTILIPLAAALGQAPSQARLVTLYASVLNQKGSPITNLPQTAFKVFENGAEQRLTLFRHDDAPISMGILIDSSGSMYNSLGPLRQAARVLAKESNPGNEIFLVNFNIDAH